VVHSYGPGQGKRAALPPILSRNACRCHDLHIGDFNLIKAIDLRLIALEKYPAGVVIIRFQKPSRVLPIEKFP
jgi:hypothetical protein